MPRVDKPRVIDVFCGAGGLSLGAARAGFAVAAGADNDLKALETHRINFPGSAHICADVSKMTGLELLKSASVEGGLDGLIGGPPCQGFSYMGHRSASDPRNQMFTHFFRLVSECEPKFFLAENVPGLMSEEYDAVRDVAFSHVKGRYRILEPMRVTASDYGSPTTRTRVFFIGYLPEAIDSLTEADFAPSVNTEKVVVSKALTGLPLKIKSDWIEEKDGWRKIRSRVNGQFGARLYGNVPEGVGDPLSLKKFKEESRVSGCLGTRHSEEILQRYSRVLPGKQDSVSKSRRLEPDGFCPTLRAGTGSDRGSYQAVRPLHPTENRVITPREAARLQGFPDWFRFDGTKWHSFRQIGNSVSPILAEHILEIINRALTGKGE